MTSHPYETEPSPDELLLFQDLGLREIRYRKDARLVVGLFFDKHDKRPVVAISTPDAVTPHVFPVDPEHANEAFDEPHVYADKLGKLILEDILVGRAV